MAAAMATPQIAHFRVISLVSSPWLVRLPSIGTPDFLGTILISSRVSAEA